MRCGLLFPPQSPFKESKELASELDRVAMVDVATAFHEKLYSSTVEFSLPKPSYTIDTLHQLKKEHSDCNFSIIIWVQIT